MKLATCLLAVVGLCALLAAPSSANWYARGSFYNDWGADDGNLLNDDGLNGDAVANDGVFSGLVTATVTAGIWEFKVANEDWSESFPGSNIAMQLDTDYQTVFVSLDTNLYEDGWFPAQNIVWSDAIRPGDTWGIVGGGGELGNWDPVAGPQADFTGEFWEVIVEFAAAGDYEYKWTANQAWDVQQLGADGFGSNAWNIILTVGEPGLIQFLLDPAAGRGWHGPHEPVAVEESTLGEIKALYR